MTDSQTTSSSPTLDRYLTGSLSAGDPEVAGPLAVYPIFGGEPRQDYVPFVEARGSGVRIHELETGASVRDLIVENPTDRPVLLYEGEEVLGAQQNRTFDVTVLAPAHSKLRVPVSCVEAGRWDGSRHGEDFAPSPQAAYPEMRRQKLEQTRASLALSGEARADQRRIWSEVGSRAASLGVDSETEAAADIYESHRDQLGEMTGAIRQHEGQAGALVAIAGRFVILDWVSRPEVFASLRPALTQGYALDALSAVGLAEAPEPPSTAEASGLLSLIGDAPSSERDGVGLGRELRFEFSNLLGSGLESDQELIQLTVHAADGNGGGSASAGLARGRVRRPSQRRRTR